MFDLAAGPVASVEGEDIREPGRDRPLDTWRVARGEACRKLVEEIHGMLLAYERAHQPRQRARRPRDAEAFRGMVEAIVCDLVHLHLTRPDGRLAVSLDKCSLGGRSRYRNPSFGRPLPHLLEMMAAPDLDLIHLDKGLWLGSSVPGSQTTIRPNGGLIGRIEGYGLSLNDLGREKGEELIILKSGKEDFWDSSEPIEYEDTPATRAMRWRVQAINALKGRTSSSTRGALRSARWTPPTGGSGATSTKRPRGTATPPPIRSDVAAGCSGASGSR